MSLNTQKIEFRIPYATGIHRKIDGNAASKGTKGLEEIQPSTPLADAIPKKYLVMWIYILESLYTMPKNKVERIADKETINRVYLEFIPPSIVDWLAFVELI
jgi:hypothetical protein